MRDLNLPRLMASMSKHWVARILNAPLVILGLGVSWDEWDLWWVLQLRARNHARLPRHLRPPTFRLVQDLPEDKFQHEPVNTSPLITPLRHGKSYNEMWERFFAEMGAK